MWSRSLQKTTSGHFDLSRDMQTLRQALKDSLTNIGILTAFLCTLGCAAYVEPTAEPKCYGETGLNLVAIILWISMGMFFLAITCTITLALDIDGVPDSLLIPHLEDNLAAHSSPLFLTYAGTFLLATGYGMDLNERVGCPVFPFGLVAAPCFPVVVLGFVAYMRRRRRRLVPLYGAKTGESMWKVGRGRAQREPRKGLFRGGSGQARGHERSERKEGVSFCGGSWQARGLEGARAQRAQRRFLLLRRKQASCWGLEGARAQRAQRRSVLLRRKRAVSLGGWRGHERSERKEGVSFCG
jgi:hypothetical protein